MLRSLITGWLAPRLIGIAAVRPHDFHVGTAADPYLLRWWLIPRNRWFNVYLHCFLRSDDERALHDHMYVNLSVLLDGEYVEHGIRRGGVATAVRRRAGEAKLRSPWTAHRIELLRDAGGELMACWTLFVTGPRLRNWGFHCPAGWRSWQEFTDPANPSLPGRGCE